MMNRVTVENPLARTVGITVTSITVSVEIAGMICVISAETVKIVRTATIVLFAVVFFAVFAKTA
jgi:hypothetical protein